MDDSSPRRRHGGRRPEGDRHSSRGRGRDRDDRDGFDRERAEREFTQEMESRLGLFVESEEQELALEPMNSFKRRIVHNLAKAYQIESESRGEERERHVFLRKTETTAVPAERPVLPPALPKGLAYFRSRAKGPSAPRVLKPKVAQSGPHALSAPSAMAAATGQGEATGTAGVPAPASPLPVPSGRAWDYGSQVFPVKPGPEGIHIALKVDGSIELYREEDKNYVVAERVVTARQFRVRQGKIVQPGEPGW